jgi:biopolymer transport protein ExbB
MFNHQSLMELVRAGGGTLVFILLCSILVLGIAIERVLSLWGFLDKARTLAETVKRCLYRGAVAEARASCERSRSPAADLFLVGFERFGRSREEALEAAVERERQRIALSLKGPLWMLGTVGATAPFIGLFGTVVGIMRAFNEIGVQHKAGIDVVGPGISEALVTTACGIAVGILAVMVYNYFQARLGRVAMELKLMSEEYVELLKEQGARGGPIIKEAKEVAKEAAAAAAAVAAPVDEPAKGA